MARNAKIPGAFNDDTQMAPRHLTRIVATLGPASNSEEHIAELIEAGVDVFRLNFSHGSREEHRANVDKIRRLAKERKTTIGILQDIPGPKLRIGVFKEEHVELETGATFRFDTRVKEGDQSQVGFKDDGWLGSVKPRETVLLGDGNVQLVVKKRDRFGLDCEVTAGGPVASRQGINFPDTDLKLGAVTDADWKHIEFGLELGVDAMALSFVQGPEDLIAVQGFIRSRKQVPLLIAKMEVPQAIQKIDEILERCDGIMVARGDLGITLPIERVPVVQKRLIRKARDAGKFVITATQMLESMTTSPRPTRAEASDVANAVFDGTDAVMLSGETAVGAHPVLVVRTMARILRETESEARLHRLPVSDVSIDEAMARSIKELVRELGSKALLVPITSGSTVRRLSRQRMGVPIIAGTLSPEAARRIGFYCSVFPNIVEDQDSMLENLKQLLAIAMNKEWVHKGDTVVVAGGYPLHKSGVTNFVRALVIGEEI